MKFGWCIVLSVAAVLFCGCSDERVAAGRLESEYKKLASDYLNGVIAEQIKLNPAHRAWSCGPSKIFLAGYDGTEVFNRVPQDKLLDEYAIARFYSAQELELSFLAVSYGKVAAYKHPQYTCRSYLKLSINEKRRMWQKAPAVSVGVTGIKGVHNVDDLKQLLQKTVINHLPDVKYDYQNLCNSCAKRMERNYEVICFICYDPELPGWVLEEPRATDKMPENASWLNKKLPLPENVVEYDQRLFWKDSLVIRQNYDRGLVLYLGKWMKAEIAEKCRQLAELTNNFDSGNCTLSELQEFLTQCAAFPAECDRKAAWSKALQAGENLIAQWQRGSRSISGNLYKLQRMRAMLSDEEVFVPLRSLQTSCNNAIKNVINIFNRSMDENISALKKVQNEITDILKRTNERDQKVQIVLERQKAIYQRLCAQDKTILDNELSKLLLFRALLEDKIKTPVDLYKYIRYSKVLRELLPEILRDCEVCRKGKVSCGDCTTLPGKCRQCRGEKFVNNDFCPLCRGSGNCDSCLGSRYKKCLSCNGRGFFIRKKTIETLQQKSFDEFAKLLQNQMNRLEAQKLRDE